MRATISRVCGRPAPPSSRPDATVAVTRHSERKVLPFTPKQLFDLVADVPRYPEFLPWCIAARVKRRESETVEIDEVAIGFGPLHEKFVSRVTLGTANPDALTIDTV